MIIDNNERKTSLSRSVERVCDVCGKHEMAIMYVVLDGRRRRKTDMDCCKKCSYKFRVLKHEKMSKSPSWNGGKYLNENGYYRVYVGNLKYEYEHKLIMSKFLGRDLTTNEKVHHIDGNKVNNSPENLSVFQSKKEHAKCHHSLELSCLSLLGDCVWFDFENEVYTTNYCKARRPIEIDISDLKLYKTYPERRHPSGTQYETFTSRKISKMLGHGHLHIVIAERIIGRKLEDNEVVHHIDGNGLNNSLGNIVVMQRYKHKICHDSLSLIGFKLLSRGIIIFRENSYETIYSRKSSKGS